MVTSILENIRFASWFCMKENVLWEIMEDTATKMFLMPNFWAPYKKRALPTRPFWPMRGEKLANIFRFP